jgi:hypothetical protein
MIGAIRYKDTLAGKGSALAEAMSVSPEAAKKVYDATTERFDALYPGAKDDRIAFKNWHKPNDLAGLVPSGEIKITAADAAMLIDLEENPRPPNAAMQRAFARLKEQA